MAAASALGVMALGRVANAQNSLTWTNKATAANWDLVTPNWNNGTTDWTNGSISIFSGAASQASQSVNVNSPTGTTANSMSSSSLSAYGITFNVNSAATAYGYQLTSNTPGQEVGSPASPVAGNTLFLATSDNTVPVVTANYAGPYNGSAGFILPAQLSQIANTVGQYQTQQPLTSGSPAQYADNLTLGGTQGFVLNGSGGVFLLANAITLTGGITVNQGATLVVGAFPTAAAGSTPASTVIPTTILNNNALTLNNSNLYINTENSVFSSPANPNQYIGNITINGNSRFLLARGNTFASSSIKFTSLSVSPGSNFTIQQAGNTDTAGSIMQFTQGTNIVGGSPTSAPVTFTASQWAVQLTSTTTSVAIPSAYSTYVYSTPVPTGFVNYSNITGTTGTNIAFGENFELGSFTDNGNPVVFQAGGYSTQAGTSVQITSTVSAPINDSGIWTLGTSATNFTLSNGSTGTTYHGAQLDLQTTSGSAGGITTSTITVNPYSQLLLDGSGKLTWGATGQNIFIAGVGDVTQSDSTSAQYSVSDGRSYGTLSFSSNTAVTTLNPLQNELLANVIMTGSSVIGVNGSTGTTVAQTSGQIDGNLTSTSTGFSLTKGGSGILYLSGTANS